MLNTSKPAHEYVLSTNEFNKPKMLEGNEAIAQLLVHLILLDPGTMPSHPTMGVGIRKYRYSGEKSLEDIRTNITRQIEQFIPDATLDSVKVDIDEDKNLKLEVGLNGIIYKYSQAEQENKVIGLDDLKTGG